VKLLSSSTQPFNYNYLNSNVHFQSEQVIKLRFWLKNNFADI